MVRVRNPEDAELELAAAELEVALAAAELDEPAAAVVVRNPALEELPEELPEPEAGALPTSLAPLGTQLVPVIGEKLFEEPGFRTLDPGLGYVGSVDNVDLQSLISARFETMSSGSAASRVMSSVSLYPNSRLALPPVMVTGAQFI